MEERYRNSIIKSYLFIALGIFIFLKILSSAKIFKEFILTPILNIFPQYPSIIEFVLVIALTTVFLLIVHSSKRLKKIFEKKIHETEKRKEIFGKSNFIEGEWFNVTIINRKVVAEYAIIRIDYDGKVGYNISGTIYDGNLDDIGKFKGIVQKYNECSKELDFSFKRESRYEEESQNLENHKLALYLKEHHKNILEEDDVLNDMIHIKGKENGRNIFASYGAGKYIFESYPHDSEPRRLHGEFYDPEKDLSMKIIGTRIRTVEEIEKERTERETELSNKEKEYSSKDSIDNLLNERRKVKNKYDEINKKRLKHEVNVFDKKYNYNQETPVDSKKQPTIKAKLD